MKGEQKKSKNQSKKVCNLHMPNETEKSTQSASEAMPPPAAKSNPIEDKSSTPDTVSGSDNDDQVYKFSFDLDDLIASTLNDICGPDSEESKKIDESLNGITTQLKGVERKQKDVNRILADCEEKLTVYQRELQKADEEEELREALAEKEAKEAAEANAKNDQSDSDDDVQFISSSFEPVVPRTTAPEQKPLTQLTTTPQTVWSGPQAPPRTVLLKIPPNVQHQITPTLENLRAALTGAINQSINKNTESSNQLHSIVSSANIPATDMSQTTKEVTPLTFAQIKAAYHADAMKIEPGFKVLGKKFNDIWYRGTVTEISQHNNIAERKYTIKFDGKGKKTLLAMHCAFKDPLNKPVSVGTRVVALYKDDESMASFYAGIVAETRNGRNQFRYLVFFDDGYAQYSQATDIHKVLAQSDNVWDDIHPDSQEFIKDYLKQYPERPMVRLKKGQTVKTEWNGRWWTAKVEEVDSSLAKMFFLADKRTEWIYRGSTRLEPLFTALANAEANKSSGKMKRHNLTNNKTPIVEYTRGISEEFKQQAQSQGHHSVPAASTNGSGNEEKKKRSVAKKSTTGGSSNNSSTNTSTEKWEAPWLKYQKRNLAKPTMPPSGQNISSSLSSPLSSSPSSSSASSSTVSTTTKSRDMFAASSISSNKQGKDMASVLQERLAKVADAGDIDEESMGERLESVLPVKDIIRKDYSSHKCSPICPAEDDPQKYKGANPLLIPLLCGWERHVCKIKLSNKRVVIYRATCARRLRSIDEMDKYLMMTKSKLTIDLFCFDPVLHVHTEFVPVRTFCDIKDLSYGKETVPISCVNGIDRQYPDYVEYSNVRIPTKGVRLNLDSDFLVGCNCTDGCRDKSKCACQQMTVDATTANGGKVNMAAGYENKRLKEPLITGLYECNSKCKCDYRCSNRVAQNSLSVRLQVFKTEKRGWGLRCLDDVPAGGFICIYAGQLLTEQGANEDGQQYGDEYLAELDYIEVVERQKEGYESDVDMDEGLGRDSDDDDESEDSDEDHASSDSDSDYAGDDPNKKVPVLDVGENPHRTRSQQEDRMRIKKETQPKDDDKPVGKLVLRRDSSRTTDQEEWSVKVRGASPEKKPTDTTVAEPILIDDDDDDEEDDESALNQTKNPEAVLKNSPKASASTDSFMDSDSLPDLDPDPNLAPAPPAPKKKESGTKELAPVPLKLENKVTTEQRQVTARRSTSGKLSRFKNLPDPKRKLVKGEDEEEEQSEMKEEEKEHPGTRSFYQDGQACYIMDAKSMGNIGRYLNHSCNPNVFVQNVFVDTHDLRFPWVAFFAGQYIRAGTELTWDYNYEVGSVPGKVLYCYCGSAECRGRLL